METLKNTGSPSQSRRENGIVENAVFILKTAAVIFVAEKLVFAVKARQFPLQPSKKPSGSPTEPFQRGEGGNAGPHALHNDIARWKTHIDRLGRGRWFKRRNKNRSNP